MTGSASRNTEPHQKYSSIRPPSTGPSALPAEKAEIQTLTAIARWRGSWNIEKISESVDGASVAPAMPSRRAAADQHLGRRRERREDRDRAERRGADQQQLAPADPVAERAHRHEEARDHEAVDVDDPEQLGAARAEVLAHRRDRQVEDRQVHHVEQAGEGEHAEADPFAAAGAGGAVVGWGGDLGSHGVVPVSCGAFVSVDHCRSRNSSLDICTGWATKRHPTRGGSSRLDLLGSPCPASVRKPPGIRSRPSPPPSACP